jgi:hypothetical protein
MLNHLTESNHNNTATILRNQGEVQVKIAVVEQQQVICDFFFTTVAILKESARQIGHLCIINFQIK